MPLAYPPPYIRTLGKSMLPGPSRYEFCLADAQQYLAETRIDELGDARTVPYTSSFAIGTASIDSLRPGLPGSSIAMFSPVAHRIRLPPVFDVSPILFVCRAQPGRWAPLALAASGSTSRNSCNVPGGSVWPGKRRLQDERGQKRRWWNGASAELCSSHRRVQWLHAIHVTSANP